jgi:hypothetical protein
MNIFNYVLEQLLQEKYLQEYNPNEVPPGVDPEAWKRVQKKLKRMKPYTLGSGKRVKFKMAGKTKAGIALAGIGAAGAGIAAYRKKKKKLKPKREQNEISIFEYIREELHLEQEDLGRRFAGNAKQVLKKQLQAKKAATQKYLFGKRKSSLRQSYERRIRTGNI